MKCILLVGGYARRMYPLTENVPKPLLKVNDKTVLDIILDIIDGSTNEIDEYILITNETFYENFVAWSESSKYREKIKIISDGSTSDEKKVGATTALIQTLISYEVDDDVLVLAGDNILDFSLDYIFKYFMNNPYSCIMYYNEDKNEKLRKTGVIEIDCDDFVSSMEEKPEKPKSPHAVPPFYWLKKEDVKKLIKKFENTNHIDSLGTIILKLCEETKIKAIKMHGKRYDVGSVDEYYKLLA